MKLGKGELIDLVVLMIVLLILNLVLMGIMVYIESEMTFATDDASTTQYCTTCACCQSIKEENE